MDLQGSCTQGIVPVRIIVEVMELVGMEQAVNAMQAGQAWIV